MIFMGRIIFGAVSLCLLGVVFWLGLGKKYQDEAEKLRYEQSQIQVQGEVLSIWADELDVQKAEVEKTEATLREAAEEVARRQSALEKLEKELERRSKSALQTTAPTIAGKYAVVVDVDTGIALYEKNADQMTAVASTQKLMTGLLVAEAGGLESVVTVEEADTLVEPTKIYFKPGEQYVRGDLLEMLLMKSGNDIALCLARDNAGSVPAFAKKMNERAIDLGMKQSNFLNPHGLTVSGQYSTARDMAKLAMAVYHQPVLHDIVGTPKTTFEMADGTAKTIINTNRVLRDWSLCDGMKTGYTRASGYCLVCSGDDGEKRRIVVVLGSDGRSVWKDSRSLLEWALEA